MSGYIMQAKNSKHKNKKSLKNFQKTCNKMKKFVRLYNTLFVHILKCIVNKIWAHNERIYNQFGYSVLSIEKERGTQDTKPEKKRYFLANYKIYRERFTTDCFSDYFNELAEKSGVGLMDYLSYKTVRASVEELKLQNSYFIRDLYGK